MTEMLPDRELQAMAPGRLLQLGIDLHNEGRFFEAHEAWEAVWLGAPEPLRPFYQGLIQMTAGFVHLTRNEFPGTHRLLEEGLAKLSRYQPDFLGVITDRLLSEATVARERVLSLGHHGLAAFDRGSIPRVHQLPLGADRRLGTPGRSLRYLEWPGRGRGAIVLVHAAGQVAHLWLPVAARLSPDWRVLVPDLPGHGESDPRPPGAAPTIDALSAWAAAVAPDLAAVIGVGASGGAIATAVAVECDAQALVCDLGSEEGPPPRRAWSDLWAAFTDLRRQQRHRDWRPDILWWLIEHGTRPVVERGIELRCSAETEAGLATAAHAGGPFLSVAGSPFGAPVETSNRLRELLLNV